MRIEHLTIQNFKGVELFDENIDGKNVYLIGGNGTGKTSFIDAVYCSLTGKNIPAKPVTTGKKEAIVDIDLGEVIVKTKYKNGKPAQLTIVEKDGGKPIASPRSYLNGLVGILDFDLQKFFAMSDAEQLKYYASFSGVNFNDLDTDVEELMESRKFDKKKLDELRPRVAFWKAEEADKEILNVSEMVAKIEAESEKRQTYSRGLSALQAKQTRITEIDKAIAALLVERNGNDYAGSYDELLGDQEKGGLLDSRDKIDRWTMDAANRGLTDEEFQALKDSLQDLEGTNDKIKEARAARDLDKEISELDKAVKEATDEIQKKREEKAERISQNINVPGLSYDLENERFLYEGLPFQKEQINTASQLIAGLKIGSMLLKELRILRVDASLIDKKEFDKVSQWVQENDISLFVELVDREAGALEIVIDEN